MIELLVSYDTEYIYIALIKRTRYNTIQPTHVDVRRAS